MRRRERRVEFDRSLSCGLRSRHDVPGRKDQVRGIVEQVSQSAMRQGITWIAVDGGLQVVEGLAKPVFRVFLRVVAAAKVVVPSIYNPVSPSLRGNATSAWLKTTQASVISLGANLHRRRRRFRRLLRCGLLACCAEIADAVPCRSRCRIRSACVSVNVKCGDGAPSRNSSALHRGRMSPVSECAWAGSSKCPISWAMTSPSILIGSTPPCFAATMTRSTRTYATSPPPCAATAATPTTSSPTPSRSDIFESSRRMYTSWASEPPAPDSATDDARRPYASSTCRNVNRSIDSGNKRLRTRNRVRLETHIVIHADSEVRRLKRTQKQLSR